MDAWSDVAGQRLRLEVPTHHDRSSDCPSFAVREELSAGEKVLLRGFWVALVTDAVGNVI